MKNLKYPTVSDDEEMSSIDPDLKFLGIKKEIIKK